MNIQYVSKEHIMKPHSHFASLAVLGALSLSAVVPALAYDYPMSSTQIRDAYFFGKGKGSVSGDFFAEYRQYFPMPATGPHVSSISIETPFAQVVERSGSAPAYSAQDAIMEFKSRPLDFIVRVEVDFTVTYPAPSDSQGPQILQPLPDFSKDFDVQLTQNDQRISPGATQQFLIRSDAAPNIWGVAGTVLELHYDAATIDSTGIVVRVRAPNDQRIQASFNLAQLR
jgi:hypothetical protein